MDQKYTLDQILLQTLNIELDYLQYKTPGKNLFDNLKDSFKIIMLRRKITKLELKICNNTETII